MLLGATRDHLRKALAILEEEGQVWRHVGKGTFIGPKPVDCLLTLNGVKQKANPPEVMRTRVSMETAIAHEAAQRHMHAHLSTVQAHLLELVPKDNFEASGGRAPEENP